MTLDVLIVKTSSLGDVVHALPVLSDLALHHPDWTVGWVVEEPFAAIPRLHPFCQTVVPVALRRWRKSFPDRRVCREWSAFKETLRTLDPRYVLDLQGLIKSAWIARQSPGIHLGYAWGSARENWATLLYDRRVSVSWDQHAVERNRALAARHFSYESATPVNYGLAAGLGQESKTALFIHSTSRDDKLWQEERWIELGRRLVELGWAITLLAGNARELQRSERLGQSIPGAEILPLSSLEEVAGQIAQAGLVVGVDTGLTHLATALAIPTIALFVVTDPRATGVYGSPVAINLGTKGESPSVEAVLGHIERQGMTR